MTKFDAIKKLDIDAIIEFRDTGTMTDVPEDIVMYLQELQKTYGMMLRNDKYGGRQSVINHLVKFDGYSQYLASKIYDEATEYFHTGRNISKEAHKNRLADLMERGVNAALAMAKDTKEIVMAIGKIPEIAKLLDLDKVDTELFPESLLSRPIKIYTSSAEDLGMPKIDRYQLGQIIDTLPMISDAAKEMCKRDSQLLPVKFFRDDRPTE